MRSGVVLALAAAWCGSPALAQDRLLTEPKAFEALIKARSAPRETAAARPIDAALAALVAGDYARARALAEPLAKGNNAAAHHLLGYLCEKGLGAPRDISAALRHYGDAAIAGDADAQMALGLLAFEGDGVYPDYERAAGWFRLAAAQGDARADVRLGLMHAEGAGVAKNLVASVRHFEKAAAAGDADGAFYLGLARLKGDGVGQSYAEAAKLFTAAADRGHGEAAYHLSLLYDSPVLGAPAPEKSLRFMRAAADAGFVPAFAAMGLIVHRGDAPGKAADWFEKGARAGDAEAALLYAVALSKGDGRPKDPLAAAALADKLLASPKTPAPLRAQAERLKREIAAEAKGRLVVRD